MEQFSFINPCNIAFSICPCKDSPYITSRAYPYVQNYTMHKTPIQSNNPRFFKYQPVPVYRSIELVCRYRAVITYIAREKIHCRYSYFDLLIINHRLDNDNNIVGPIFSYKVAIIGGFFEKSSILISTTSTSSTSRYLH